VTAAAATKITTTKGEPSPATPHTMRAVADGTAPSAARRPQISSALALPVGGQGRHLAVGDEL
jgi:hypothetical protein